MSRMEILVADDDPSIRSLLRNFLETEEYAVSEARSGAEVLKRVGESKPQLLLMDLRMPDLDGIEVLQRMHEDDDLKVPTLLMTAHGTASTAIKAIQLGAFDYITKPFELEDVLITIRRFFEYEALSTEVQTLRQRLERDPYERSPDRIIGNSTAMQEVYKIIGKVAQSDATVLIQGETGTGKELVARIVHFNSGYRHGPLITVSCAALPETLLESELFGHEKGSFTSAVTQRKGRFELAHKGTIFLDEVGEMSLNTQKKLLRVLQEKEFERVGGSTPIKIDVRVVAATNQNLAEAVTKKTFRDDLYYRLNVITITMPPLRDRKEDISLLAEYFLDRFRFNAGSPPSRISEEAVKVLQAHDWPGNVRQLENTIQRAVVMAQGGVITSHHLLLEHATEKKFVDIESKVREKVPMKEVMAEIEKQMIIEALNQANGNRSLAAKNLGIYRRLLYAKMKDYGIAEN